MPPDDRHTVVAFASPLAGDELYRVVQKNACRREALVDGSFGHLGPAGAQNNNKPHRPAAAPMLERQMLEDDGRREAPRHGPTSTPWTRALKAGRAAGHQESRTGEDYICTSYILGTVDRR